MRVAEVVGRTLAQAGVGHVFGLVGSGNFHVTNALVAAGARFVPAAHEAGAATMADAYARVSGRLGVLSVHQGPGVTNALTGITEAAKSRTPLLVLAPEATAPRSNFFIDLPAAAAAARRAVPPGARGERRRRHVGGGTRGGRRPRRWCWGCRWTCRAADRRARAPMPAAAAAPGRDESARGRRPRWSHALRTATRPVFIAGRGATRQPARTRAALTRLADRCGALLAVSAAAKGLFAGDPWYLDISGGFATPLAAELISGSDLVVAWGSTLNMWTTRHGRLIPAGATVAQVDVDGDAIGVNRAVDVGVVGDVALVADAVLSTLDGWSRRGLAESRAARADRGRGPVARRALSWTTRRPGRSTRARSASPSTTCCRPSARWSSTRATSWAIRRCSCRCRTRRVLLHAGVPVVGLGLASALGAAVARPDRLTVAALGDGGFLMSAAELATAVRLGLPLRDRGLQRRGVRGRGAPLRPGRAPARHGPASPTPTWRRSPAGTAARASPCGRRPTWRRCATGSPGRATGRSWSTRRSARSAARGGWRRRSGVTDRPHVVDPRAQVARFHVCCEFLSWMDDLSFIGTR